MPDVKVTGGTPTAFGALVEVVVVDVCVVLVLDVLDVVVGGTVDEDVAEIVLVLDIDPPFTLTVTPEPPIGMKDEIGELLEPIGTVADGSVAPLLSLPS